MLYLGRHAQNAPVASDWPVGRRRHRRTDVHADAIGDVGLPANGLLVDWLPAVEDVVEALAPIGIFSSWASSRCSAAASPAIGTINARAHIGALAGNPVDKSGVDQLFQCLAAFTIGPRTNLWKFTSA